MKPDALELEIRIEIPKGSFLKRGRTEQVDFVSPFPCPFNYGAADAYIGLEGDLLDAVVLGARLPRGKRVVVRAVGSVGLTDRGLYDDKLICSYTPLSRQQQFFILSFFKFYARAKWILNLFRGQRGRHACEGWQSAEEAIARATPRSETVLKDPQITF